jgi:fructose-bisphosphate aldolase class I
MQVEEIAQLLVAPTKGILAADESTGTMAKRLAAVGVASTKDTRREYREMIFSIPGIEQFISGVILFEETLRSNSGQVLLDKGILLGIKVDQGINSEEVTEGLTGLKERLEEYKKYGAVFAKWRAVVTIGAEDSLAENAIRLAEYARICQEAGIVPIVEPEVLMDGDHTLADCDRVTEKTLRTVFAKLSQKNINLKGMLLKPNMVLSGKDSTHKTKANKEAEATINCFKKVVPKTLAGIVFLSGGLSPDEATERLRLINQNKDLTWPMSFSFGRALQQEALQAWSGTAENKAAAQAVFLQRAQQVSLARQGK